MCHTLVIIVNVLACASSWQSRYPTIQLSLASRESRSISTFFILQKWHFRWKTQRCHENEPWSIQCEAKRIVFLHSCLASNNIWKASAKPQAYERGLPFPLWAFALLVSPAFLSQRSHLQGRARPDRGWSFTVLPSNFQTLLTEVLQPRSWREISQKNSFILFSSSKKCDVSSGGIFDDCDLVDNTWEAAGSSKHASHPKDEGWHNNANIPRGFLAGRWLSRDLDGGVGHSCSVVPLSADCSWHPCSLVALRRCRGAMPSAADRSSPPQNGLTNPKPTTETQRDYTWTAADLESIDFLTAEPSASLTRLSRPISGAPLFDQPGCERARKNMSNVGRSTQGSGKGSSTHLGLSSTDCY